MLKTLRIKNFQKHEKFRVDFDERISTLVGPSDTGKSAVMRALRWVCLNRPRGDSFIRNGEKQATVSLVVDDQQIVRKRGGENQFALRKRGVEEQQYKAFGNDVPQQIASLLQLGEVNFQLQHDPPFWFCKTAGEVAKELNEIVDLGVIDEVMAKIASLIRKGRVEVDLNRERLENSEAESKRLSFVPTLVAEFEGLEGKQKKAVEKRTRVGQISDIVARAIEYQTIQRNALRAASRGSTVVSKGQGAGRLQKRVRLLSELVGEIQEVSNRVNQTIPDMGVLDKAKEKAGEKRELYVSIRDLKREVICQLEIRNHLYSRLRAAQETLKEETGGLCPICGKQFERDLV